MNETTQARQQVVCQRFKAPYVPCAPELTVGIARNVKNGVRPLNGLRLPQDEANSCWYIWAGDQLSLAPDFFVTLPVSELAQWAPLVIPYLGLPPGWRFVVTEHHEDAWEDTELIDR